MSKGTIRNKYNSYYFIVNKTGVLWYSKKKEYIDQGKTDKVKELNLTSSTIRNWKEPEKLSLFDEVGKELKLKFSNEEEKFKWLEAFNDAGLGK